MTRPFDAGRRGVAGLRHVTDEEAMAGVNAGELTHVEIAARLQIPLGTVKGRIRLGMGRLRGELADLI